MILFTQQQKDIAMTPQKFSEKFPSTSAKGILAITTFPGTRSEKIKKMDVF